MGTAHGDLDKLQPLRTTNNGTLVVEGCVSIDHVLQTQGETELVGKTADSMLATQKAILKEMRELHDTTLAMASMLEKSQRASNELLESLNAAAQKGGRKGDS